MKIITTLLIITLNVFKLAGLVELTEHDNTLYLTTLYGTTAITEPVLIDLIKCPAFERLKHISQYGVECYVRTSVRPPFIFTRYQHSLGVFFLTRKYGAPPEEQINALVHDVSHTAFSHVGDVLFNSNYRTGKQSYQDEIHEWYLEKVGVADILRKHGYDVAQVITEGKKKHRCFDQDLPNICADRIEYNLSGGFLDEYIAPKEIQDLLNTLHFTDGQWFFDNVESAKKLAYISLQLSENRWGSAWGAFIDQCAARAIKRGCELGLITLDDVHFSIDETIWHTLTRCNDAHIAKYIKYIQYCHNHFCLSSAAESDEHLIGKFSGIDPFVSIEGKLYRLTSLDEPYKKEFDRVKKLITGGWHIQYKTVNEPCVA